MKIRIYKIYRLKMNIKIVTFNTSDLPENTNSTTFKVNNSI